MSNLIYNIDFEFTALLFTILLFIETRIHYPIKAVKGKTFSYMTIMVIITEVFDLISAYTNTYSNSLPKAVNLLTNSGYFMSGMYLCYIFHKYIEKVIVNSEKDSRLLKVNRIVLIIMELAVVLNIPFGYFFHFENNGAYTHGVLFLLLHGISCWFVICASAALIINRHSIEKKKMASSVLFVMIYSISVILQTFVFPHILIIMPSVSAMLIVAIFSLESPDYAKLQDALKELTVARNQLEESNQKYCYLAYNDHMTGIKNRTAYNIRIEQLNTLQDKQNIIIMIADINALKKLNDNHGHLVGDDAIQRTAKLLKKNFRDYCQCYRIGGDEFAVISYRNPEEVFLKNYHQFLDDVQKEKLKTSYAFSVASGYQIIGSDTVLEALKKADKKMYENKIALKESEIVYSK